MPAKMKIRSAYSTLPTAERKVADFILENPARASLMVINEIAEAAGVSVPSVTRLARKLGYNGFGFPCCPCQRLLLHRVPQERSDPSNR